MNIDYAIFVLILTTAIIAMAGAYQSQGRRLVIQTNIAKSLRLTLAALWRSDLKLRGDNLKLNINTGELLSELAVHADEIKRLQNELARCEKWAELNRRFRE